MTINKLILLIATLPFFWSCGSGDNEAQRLLDEKLKKEQEMEELFKQTEFEKQFEENFSFTLPAPYEIVAAFQKAGLSYREDITSPPEKFKEYNTEIPMSLNFGVFSADLSYTILNGKSQKSIEYFKAIRELSEPLGLEPIFNNEEFNSIFIRNIENQDSIIYLLGQVQKKMDILMHENGNFYKSVIYFTGAWIEGMYIGASSIDENNKKKVADKLIEQLGLLKSLIKGIEQQPAHKEELKSLKVSLIELQTDMNKILKRKFKAIENEQEFKISGSAIDSIKTKVLAIRAEIVKSI